VDKIEIAKKAVEIVVGFGTSRIVGSIVSNNVPTTNLFQKVTVTVASVAIGSLVAEKTAEHTNEKIDEMVDWYRTNVR
jgi:uncharacterized membrane protein